MKPFFSCIVTAFNEGPTAVVALNSLLAQTFTDFEVLVVHDGADKLTEKILLSYQDPRFLHIIQTNDGLSSARNRAIPHCKGEYVCFLDADDLRANWALDSIYASIVSNNNPDCIFSPGLLVEVRNEVLPFYDQPIFNYFDTLEKASFAGSEVDAQLAKVALIEPQSANKTVKKTLIDKYKLRYPTGQFFEDSFFHAGVIACMESFAVSAAPTFTYFRRYGRGQITAGSGLNRLDAISVAFMTLEYWGRSARFSNKAASAALFLSLFKTLQWCQESIAHMHRYNFEYVLKQNVSTLSIQWIDVITSKEMTEIIRGINWAPQIFSYIKNNLSVNIEY